MSDDKKTEETISKFLSALQPTERTCDVCGKKFMGLRDVCDDEKCFKPWYWAMQIRRAENRERWGRPIDYNSMGKRVLIIDSLPQHPTVEETYKDYPPTIAEPEKKK